MSHIKAATKYDTNKQDNFCVDDRDGSRPYGDLNIILFGVPSNSIAGHSLDNVLNFLDFDVCVLYIYNYQK